MSYNYVLGEKKMKYILSLITGIFLFAVSAQAEEIILKANTFVPVVLQENISSENLSLGQDVLFTVARDVIVSGKTIISAGTSVIANVSDVEETGAIGAAGKIVITFLNTEAVDGTSISLRGTKVIEGKDKSTSSVVVGVVLCPLALLQKGDEANMGQGTQARAMVAQNTTLEL